MRSSRRRKLRLRRMSRDIQSRKWAGTTLTRWRKKCGAPLCCCRRLNSIHLILIHPLFESKNPGIYLAREIPIKNVKNPPKPIRSIAHPRGIREEVRVMTKKQKRRLDWNRPGQEKVFPWSTRLVLLLGR